MGEFEKAISHFSECASRCSSNSEMMGMSNDSVENRKKAETGMKRVNECMRLLESKKKEEKVGGLALIEDVLEISPLSEKANEIKARFLIKV
jgi:hypothetical protein